MRKAMRSLSYIGTLARHRARDFQDTRCVKAGTVNRDHLVIERERQCLENALDERG
jgi:hypothetical protein